MIATPTTHFDAVILGAGAAGLMCAIAAGTRGHRVLVLDSANKVGKKILMSGGGRCNFTNLHCGPDNFLSANPHFVRSALSRYTQWDFIALVEKHGIPYHEKTLGQLFCDRSSKDIVALLLAECAALDVRILTHSPTRIEALGPPHRLDTREGPVTADALVVATGGYSIPTLGSTGFAFDLARELGIAVEPTRAALVPVTLPPEALAELDGLAGVSLEARVSAGSASFEEGILFTHRGLSGPAVLQASSYWQPGEELAVDLFPEFDIREHLHAARAEHPKQMLRTLLGGLLTKRVAQRWCERGIPDRPLDQLSERDIEQVADACQPWLVHPDGTEGYRVAEVTLGGVSTAALSSKTMECREHPGLYFIGEAVDVTGHLGGHNFQWAWASGQAAGQAV